MARNTNKNLKIYISPDSFPHTNQKPREKKNRDFWGSPHKKNCEINLENFYHTLQ